MQMGPDTSCSAVALNCDPIQLTSWKRTLLDDAEDGGAWSPSFVVPFSLTWGQMKTPSVDRERTNEAAVSTVAMAFVVAFTLGQTHCH